MAERSNVVSNEIGIGLRLRTKSGEIWETGIGVPFPPRVGETISIDLGRSVENIVISSVEWDQEYPYTVNKEKGWYTGMKQRPTLIIECERGSNIPGFVKAMEAQGFKRKY